MEVGELLKKVKDVVEKIENQYDPEYGAYTEERSEGNSMDVFQDGLTSGYNEALYDIGRMLGLKLAAPELPEMDS
ncbi:hypothetical protein [Paenibacillus illinoisensis]|uniref:hypothetical protein n=1 Tax=Paenibacillus illinoisensis TaxID=59845 RepID=UPI003017849B